MKSFYKFALLPLLVGAVAACQDRDFGSSQDGRYASERTFLGKTENPVVSATGKIRVPENYRTELTFIGAWGIAGDEENKILGLHNVYASPDAIAAYRKTGQWPDGTILLKELMKGINGFRTTGEVAWGQEVEGWFVMIKDAKGRFPENPLWAQGWGWSYFDAANPTQTKSESFEADCMTCHQPAEATDWVFTEAYPILSSEK